MIELLVFSKNRSAQCDLTIRSIKQFVKVPHRITVLYTHDKPFEEGYARLRARHGESVRFLYESAGFAFNFFTWLDTCAPGSSAIMLPDDEVFIAPLDFNPPVHGGIVSLRLNPRCDYCYPAGKAMDIPKFNREGELNFWDWREHNPFTDWGYPHNIENLYDVRYLREVVRGGTFANPNQLEAYMNGRRNRNVRMCCYDHSRLVIIPANRVHGRTPVQAVGESLESCERQFLAGMQIELPVIENNTACQVEHIYKWTI